MQSPITNGDGVLERVNIRLWSADLAFLRHRYPDNYNAQIRRIVGSWVDNQKEKDKNDAA